MDFSEESELLIEHWDTFQDAKRVYERLEEDELPKLLDWIASSVEDEPWSDGWHRRETRRNSLVYSNPNWIGKDDRTVGVGAYSISLDTLFSPDDPLFLHVWVWKFYPELIDRLLTEIEERGLLTVGEADHRGNNVTVVKMPLPTSPPVAPEDLPEKLRQQALRFFEHYLPVLMSLDDVIREELAACSSE
ncbi:MAG: hypothetical protein ACQER1_16310 [Armatimonadota bacterium]